MRLRWRMITFADGSAGMLAEYGRNHDRYVYVYRGFNGGEREGWVVREYRDGYEFDVPRGRGSVSPPHTTLYGARMKAERIAERFSTPDA